MFTICVVFFLNVVCKGQQKYYFPAIISEFWPNCPISLNVFSPLLFLTMFCPCFNRSSQITGVRHPSDTVSFLAIVIWRDCSFRAKNIYFPNLVNFQFTTWGQFWNCSISVSLFQNCPSVFQSASLDVSSGVCKVSCARVNFCMCVCCARASCVASHSACQICCLSNCT